MVGRSLSDLGFVSSPHIQLPTAPSPGDPAPSALQTLGICTQRNAHAHKIETNEAAPATLFPVEAGGPEPLWAPTALLWSAQMDRVDQGFPDPQLLCSGMQGGGNKWLSGMVAGG